MNKDLQTANFSEDFEKLYHQLIELGPDWVEINSNKSVLKDGSRNFFYFKSFENIFDFVFFLNTKTQCVKGVVQFGLCEGPVG